MSKRESQFKLRMENQQMEKLAMDASRAVIQQAGNACGAGGHIVGKAASYALPSVVSQFKKL